MTPAGGHDSLALEIVGKVEERRDEDAIGGKALGGGRLPRPADGQLLRHEATLGADRHDHRVLHLLCLAEAEHLGAEILRPVRPADAAARHAAEAEMQPVDARAVHEDLAERAWRGQSVDGMRIELEADFLMRRAIRGELEEVGADGRRDGVEEAPHDAVLVEALHVLQRRLDPRRALRRGLAMGAGREPGMEIADQRVGEAAVGD